MQDMDANELVNWMAYELSCDEKFRAKAEKEIATEKALKMSDTERAEAIKQMFQQIAVCNGPNK